MLAIALIPSLALLLAGLVVSGFVIAKGVQTYRWANDLAAGVEPGARVVGDLQLERWLSLVRVGGGQVNQAQLADQRRRVDADLAAVATVSRARPELANAILGAAGAGGPALSELTGVRNRVDHGQISLIDTYNYYDQLLAPIADYVTAVAGQAPNANIAGAQLVAAALYATTEGVARANALSFSAAIHGGMDGVEFAEFSRQVGAYQSALAATGPQMTSAEQSRYQNLTGSPAWRQLAAVQDQLSGAGPLKRATTAAQPLAVSSLDWQNDTLQVTGQMLALFDDHFRYAASLASTDGRDTLERALLVGIAILLLGIVVLVVAVRLANGVARRLLRLRGESLDVAEEHLPRIVERLRNADDTDIDVARELPTLDHGTDEIGQVAEAFNTAQRTAVAAAVAEARTRHGANAVFLNIAHRSQVVAHRQLRVLDLAERRQDDPQQVQFLFQLDHLATRARRNAENLIILGGERPARQWRKAVPVREVVRSAIGETRHFERLRTGRLPDVAIAGRAVADVVHLLAELLDNATGFAPPDARAEVRGNVVGTGVVLEVEDQGLGIRPEDLDAINANLLSPPDYGVLALTEDTRLGLYVVARLAARHDIRVTLAESAYGGTRAIVLLPAALVEADGPEQRDGDTAVLTVLPPTDTTPTDIDWSHSGGGAPPLPRRRRNGAAGGSQSVPNGGGVAVQDPPAGAPGALPRRQRRANLAPQLLDRAEPPLLAADDPQRSASGTSAGLAAFQRGTQRARDVAEPEGAAEAGGPDGPADDGGRGEP